MTLNTITIIIFLIEIKVQSQEIFRRYSFDYHQIMIRLVELHIHTLFV
ncbi:hypothetical protein A0H76_3007 [Hepatospora eriocheir]|uniref:Uncharacterized protein n=1 Tax=Hepatospora eriocheir TaxID=1081669 RepID=A0A1X0QKS4_9MICR|nr:hypothetical protein A0H76_3007 [Hepatospora eriocheir]